MTDLVDKLMEIRRSPFREKHRSTIVQAANEIKRLRMFLAEISAMGPADEEWDANTLEDAVELAKRALNQQFGNPASD